MKKFLLLLCILFCFSCFAQPAFATNTQIQLDGMKAKIASETITKNGTFYVPLRTVGKLLCATVDWTPEKIEITQNNVKIVLKVNESTAIKNGQSIPLNAKPYLLNNTTTMVPLRFISEAFGYGVDYKKAIVSISTPPLYINNTKIKCLEYEWRMTMGSQVEHYYGNIYIQKLYETYQNCIGNEVAEPKLHGYQYNMDVEEYYWEDGFYQFLSAIDGKPVISFHIYQFVGRDFATGNKKNPPEGYSNHLIYDVLNDKWYTINEEAWNKFLTYKTTMHNYHLYTVISNTIV